MACSNCGSVCGICGCTDGSCGCSAALTPYYSQAPGCQEEHTNLVVQNKYETTICTAERFNIPACDASIVVTIPDLQKITLNTYLWHPNYGYLKVTNFDAATCRVTLKNECQNGNAAVGTAIPACTCFIVVDNPTGVSDPCINAVVSQGALVVCKDGVLQPLDATASGQVPVSVDAGTNEVEFRTIDTEVLECTTLDAQLSLFPATTSYTLIVVDSSICIAGEVIVIGGTSNKLVVTGIPDGTTIEADLLVPVTAIVTYPVGTEICKASCCDQIQKQFNDIDTWIATPCNWVLTPRFDLITDTATSVDIAITSVVAGAEVPSNYAALVIDNASCGDKLVIIDAWFRGDITVAGTDYSAYMMSYPQYGQAMGITGTVPLPVPITTKNVHNVISRDTAGAPSGEVFSVFNTWHENVIVPSGQSLIVRTLYVVGYITGGGVTGVAVSNLQTGLKAAIIQF